MPRVQIRYEDNSTVEANNLEDALIHLVTQGTDNLRDVVEELPPPDECKHCAGTGRAKQGQPRRLLTAKQARDKVAVVEERAESPDFEERARLARQVASS